MSVLVPPGYAGIIPLTITNPSSTLALGGSTTTPVGASSTDYVVICHLVGTAASTVYSGALDQSGFSDVTVWWTDGSGVQHQLDTDPDVTANGAWSTTNVTLRFRLQASIAASGTDSNYGVAFGSTLPTALHNLANIYPFWDAFAGTTLDSSKWTAVTNSGAGSTVSVNNGLTIFVPQGTPQVCYVRGTSSYQFGANYLFEVLASVIPAAAGDQGSTTTGIALGRALVGPAGSGTDLNACVGFYQMDAIPPSFSFTTVGVAGTLDTAAHRWQVSRDAAGSSYASLDGASSSVTTAPQQYTTAVPPMIFVSNNHNTQNAQISAQWAKVRPWNGVGLDPVTTAGPPILRSGTVIASSTSSAPLVRGGAASITRDSAADWLLLYSDGTSARSRSGASTAALAAATAATAAASATGIAGGTLISGGSDGTALAVLADTSGGNPADVRTYSAGTGLWTAGNATGLPASSLFAGTLYVSAGTSYWHLLSAAAGGTQVKHWVATAQAGPFTAMTTATTGVLPASDPCLALAAYAGNVVGATIDNTGHVAYATLDAATATSGGTTMSASTLALTGSALATSENLALLNSADNGAGALWLAYNNGLGLCVRSSPVGGPLSWSAETQISSNSFDSCPTLVRDGTGAVTLFWISGAAGNPIQSQRLQIVSGAIYLAGSILTRTTYSAVRSLLSCGRSEPSGTVGLVWLES